MESELALHGPDDLARLHREHRVVEGLHHRAARIAAEIASLSGGARILRELLRELCELRRVGLRLRGDVFGLLLRRRPLGFGRVLLDRDEDVRGLPLLFLRVGLRCALVLRLHLVGRHRRLRQQRIGREDHVLELRLLGRLERGRVLVVERLHLRVVDLDVLHERLGVDRRDFDFALLLDEVEEPRGRCLRHDAAARDRVDDLSR